MREGETTLVTINEWDLLKYIKAHPQQKIYVKKTSGSDYNSRTSGISGGSQKYELTTNFKGELCYQDGPAKRTFPVSGKGFEICEESQQLMDAAYEKEPSDDQSTVQVNKADTGVKITAGSGMTSLDPDTFRRGFNNFVEAVVSEHKPERPKVQEAKECLPKLTTRFRLVVPPDFQLEDLVVQYVLVISQSLTMLQKSEQAGQYQVDVFETEGRVKNIPGLFEQLEKELKKAGIDSRRTQPNGAYARWTAWTGQPRTVILP